MCRQAWAPACPLRLASVSTTDAKRPHASARPAKVMIGPRHMQKSSYSSLKSFVILCALLRHFGRHEKSHFCRSVRVALASSARNLGSRLQHVGPFLRGFPPSSKFTSSILCTEYVCNLGRCESSSLALRTSCPFSPLGTVLLAGSNRYFYLRPTSFCK